MSNCGSTPTSLSICLAGANLHSAAAAGEAEPATASAIALAVATSSMRPRGATERMRPSKAAIPKKSNNAIPIPPYIPRSPMCPGRERLSDPRCRVARSTRINGLITERYHATQGLRDMQAVRGADALTCNSDELAISCFDLICVSFPQPRDGSAASCEVRTTTFESGQPSSAIPEHESRRSTPHPIFVKGAPHDISTQ